MTKLDPWLELRQLTHARIALGRAGHALPTKALLDFRLAHSRARDAVWREVDFAPLRSSLAIPSERLLEVQSQCSDKQNYLLNPDLGRTLTTDARTLLAQHAQGTPDCVLVVADGLSSAAVEANGAAFCREFCRLLAEQNLTLAPIVLARYARVALGDDIGTILNARSVIMLIGERPGLGSAESLSVYFTYAPSVGKHDADRNCISNIHADGLPPTSAAAMALYLLLESSRKRMSGVQLKVEFPAVTRR